MHLYVGNWEWDGCDNKLNGGRSHLRMPGLKKKKKSQASLFSDTDVIPLQTEVLGHIQS